MKLSEMRSNRVIRERFSEENGKETAEKYMRFLELERLSQDCELVPMLMDEYEELAKFLEPLLKLRTYRFHKPGEPLGWIPYRDKDKGIWLVWSELPCE